MRSMATILQRLTRALSPTVIGEIAKTAGLEPELARRGVTAAGHVVLLALADGAALPGGPARVFRMLPAGGTPMLGELAFVARAGVPVAVLTPVLGARVRAVSDRLDRTFGFRASSMLPIATATVVGLTARIVEEHELDAAGLAELLALEASELLGDAGPIAQLVHGVHGSPTTDHRSSVVNTVATPADDAFGVDEAMTRFRRAQIRANAAEAVREALDTISRLSPSAAPRFRRLVQDVASCVGPKSHGSPTADVQRLRVRK